MTAWCSLCPPKPQRLITEVMTTVKDENRIDGVVCSLRQARPGLGGRQCAIEHGHIVDRKVRRRLDTGLVVGLSHGIDAPGSL